MYNNEYLEFFNKYIQPHVKEFEQIRWNYLTWYFSIYTVAIICLLGMFGRLDIINNLDDISKWAMFIYSFCLVTVFAHPIACMMITRYRAVVKERFLKILLEKLYGLKYYNPNPTVFSNMLASYGANETAQHIDAEELSSLSVLRQHGSISYDDYIKGKYKDLGIEIQELSLYRRVKNSNECLFHGLIMSVDVKKEFKNKTVFYADKELQNDADIKGLESVYTEDVEFNKMFNVYSNDQIEARYIFSPIFMEKMKSVMLKNPQYKINGEFNNKKLYIVLSSDKNWFEIPFFKSAENISVFYQPVNDICNLLLIADNVL